MGELPALGEETGHPNAHSKDSGLGWGEVMQ